MHGNSKCPRRVGPLAGGEIQGYEPVAPLGAAGMIAALLFFGLLFFLPILIVALVVEVYPARQPRDVGRVHARRQPFSPKEKRVFQEL